MKIMLIALALIAASASGRADPLEVIWDERIAVAAGSGFRGPWHMNESQYDYVDDPTVAIDERGIVAVAWVDQSRKDIFVQVYEPGGKTRFEEPVNVSGSPDVLS